MHQRCSIYIKGVEKYNETVNAEPVPHVALTTLASCGGLVMQTIKMASVVFVMLAGSQLLAASIEDVRFLTRIETYEAIVNTTLVTQEGQKIPITRGTKLNVAGFTETEAFILSRSDRPTGFIRKRDLAPSFDSSGGMEEPRIKEETIRD
jgi:hypothetical protein